MPWFGWNKSKVVATNEKENENASFDKDETNELDDDTLMYQDDDLNEKAQDLIADNLEVMRDIIFRIREDEDFAKSIYANCPRLQHLLKEHPDLRPIFEDPNLIRLNFEKVYRDQGGILPEDDDDDDDQEKNVFHRSYDFIAAKVAIITSHPLFKVFKFLMLIKKIVTFFSPTKGFSVIKGFFVGLFTDPDALPVDSGLEDVNPANLELRTQLYAAAEHMEDPEVQERMDEMLENPEMMEEAIENDPQLRALRDENDLCAALMSNPETMRILVDPENLRALAEAPDLIEKDFSDPGGFVPPAPEEPPTLQTDPDVDIPAGDEADAPEGEEEEPSMLEEIAENREDEEGAARGNVSRGGVKSRSAANDDKKDEAKSWMQAAAGVVGGQALAAIGIGDLLSGDALEEAPTVEGESSLPEGGVPPEEAEDEFAPVELELNSGATNSAVTSKGTSTSDRGSGLDRIKGAVVGLAAGSVLGSVLSSEQAALVTKLNENLADRRAEAEESGDKSEGQRDASQSQGRFAFLGAVKDVAITTGLGAVIGNSVVEDIEGIKDDVDELRDEEDRADCKQQSEGADRSSSRGK